MAGGVEEEGDVAALREALRQEAQAVEKLRSELEEERQAAASGADEALAMIVRLQAEKAAERMEAEQFRRVAEERIQHDEDTLAFLKAVVFHQEMEISSLNRRLLAVHAPGDDPLSPAVDLPWLRKLAKSGGAASRRNASLPAVHLEELCSELDVDAGKKSTVGDRRPERTISDIGEVIGREKEWATRPNQAVAPTHRLHRSASYRLPRRAPSYSAQAQCGVRSAAGRASPEIIAEEDEKSCKSNAALEADVEQIKATVQSLQTELTKLRESTLSVGDAHSKILAEIHAMLDGGVAPPWRQRSFEAPSLELLKKKATTSREGGGSSRSSSSSKEQSYQPLAERELLMNHFIEVPDDFGLGRRD
ncbi:hypothetical protein BDA96_07G104000 [Sorghum bicolor]|uniref:GTD-binding domain-containing protein n=2 Tax=Sorghum bicolor TaxID=4558 RepID=A0A921QLR0_SORBI|nr:uncharacterized protein LOC8076261 isoform X2 [Sorghum bicolor]KAG0523205.1 hypothetical protein BDA96_07G104000 [Sorghum bicolor]KAG0523206.1 hypothetical protein BDA96_07G104000 [Sorghum bicolor]KXG24886.1 hypothetical protein SORBI_3007G097700 [Sorghum bicolor]KXG24887.1 hypothetical protein SORBI_3007G097700 [Sorghum bicolor]OQU80233.1 hypothetical protein SORBI_3007G097700 [Sorghum bicolor]|eukprot:XP_021320049.1 uncharacterized protein LOC8076261 isoform X2 [Sorghum bicolor]